MKKECKKKECKEKEVEVEGDFRKFIRHIFDQYYKDYPCQKQIDESQGVLYDGHYISMRSSLELDYAKRYLKRRDDEDELIQLLLEQQKVLVEVSQILQEEVSSKRKRYLLPFFSWLKSLLSGDKHGQER